MTKKMTIPPELEGEYIVRVIDTPDCAHGFVIYDDDDFANVYVNARLNRESQRDAADHEMTHVINDDIHSAEGIRTVEARADGRRRKLPKLFKARDLLPPKPKPKPTLTPYQLRILKQAVAELDAAMHETIYDKVVD